MEARWKAAIAAALVLGAGALWAVRARGGSEAAPVAPARMTEGAPRAAGTPRPPRRTAEPEARAADEAAEPKPPPRSLRGTEIDGALRVDDSGNLILGPEVIAFFDYFLTATGEESAEAIRQRILAAIRERLDGPAAAQAAALLDRYLAYREASRSLRVESGDEGDPAKRLEAIRRLRREQFGEEAAEALFGDEEREGAVAVAKREVALDPTLTPEEREARLAELDEDLPEAAREAREEARRPLRQQAEEQAMRAAGATDEELYQRRVETVGVEAADRLAALDRDRADWKRRLEAFREERERLAARAHDDAERLAQEEALLEQRFTPEERLRVRAILRMPAP